MQSQFKYKLIRFLTLVLLASPSFMAGNQQVLADTHIKCGFSELGNIGAENLVLRRAGSLRPQLTHEYLTEDKRFLLHYNTTGDSAIDTTSTIVPGVPDWIIAAQQALAHSWHLLVDSLGFIPPPMDSVGYGADPPGGAHDIYFVDFSYYGYTLQEDLVKSTSRPQDYTGFMLIENDFKGFDTEGVAGLKVTLAHEFFHLIHLGYAFKIGNGISDLWWYELSSTWFENVAYPSIDDYLNYVSTYFSNPKPLDQSSGYEVGFYGEILSSYHVSSLMGSIWEYFIHHTAYESIDHSLNDKASSSFGKSYQKFAGWNLVTGYRASSNFGYSDAARFPIISTNGGRFLADSLHLSGTVPQRAIFYYLVRSTEAGGRIYSAHFQPQTGDLYSVFSPDNDPAGLVKFSRDQSDHDIAVAGSPNAGYFAVANANTADLKFSVQLQQKVFRIYPNPLYISDKNTLNIYIGNGEFDPVIRVYDVRGREVLRTGFFTSVPDPASQVTLRISAATSGLSRLPSGIYFLRLTVDHETKVGKFTIIK